MPKQRALTEAGADSKAGQRYPVIDSSTKPEAWARREHPMSQVDQFLTWHSKSGAAQTLSA